MLIAFINLSDPIREPQEFPALGNLKRSHFDHSATRETTSPRFGIGGALPGCDQSCPP